MPPQSVPSVVTPPWRHVLWLIFAMVCVSPGARACDSGSVIGPGQSGLGGGIPDSAVVHGITGAGGIADLCMGFSDIYPQANAYWENTLNWVVATAVDMGGGTAWRTFENWPGREKFFGHPTAAWNAQLLAEGYLRTQKTEYRDLALSTMDWLLVEADSMSQYIPGKPGLVFLEFDPAIVPNVHWYSNTVFNQVGIGQGALDVFRATGDPDARAVTLGIADALLSCADTASVGYKWRTYWPANPGLHADTTHALERCAGGGGSPSSWWMWR